MNRIDHKNALPPGYRLQEYTIESVLGHGGFGITYRARDAYLEKPVAIKEYLPQEFATRDGQSTVAVKSNHETDRKLYRWGLKRFVAEAQALAKFKHPNIVRVLRFIEANNSAYLVMDYEPGQSLQDYLDRHGFGLPEEQLKAIFLPVLDGLAFVHDFGLLHRDIKPHNIYLRADSSPMLIDFGSVRVGLGEKSRSTIAVFTPGFAPFEQYSTRGNQGSWTDIYGIGASLYYCMSGSIVPDANDRCFSLLHHEPDPYQPIRSVAAGRYSEALLESVDAALAFRVKDRLATARALRAQWLRGETIRGPSENPGSRSFRRSSGFAFLNRFSPIDGPTRLREATTPAPRSGPPASGRLEPLRSFLHRWLGNWVTASRKLGLRLKNRLAVTSIESRTESAPVSASSLSGEKSYTTLVQANSGMFVRMAPRGLLRTGGLVFAVALALAYAAGMIGPQSREKTSKHGLVGFPETARTAFNRSLSAAAQGDAWAQYELGRRYEKGEGVAKDYRQAAFWYRRAAEQGNEWAQYTLGWMYEKGKGVDQDPEKSVFWYRKAAEQGNAWAQNNLGSMYVKGKGVRKNPEMAKHWYQQAADQGLWVARDNLRGLSRN